MFKWGSPKSRGDQAGDRALRYLQQQGLQLIERNYRVAAGPHVRGIEVDLILRARASTAHGGAAASVTPTKSLRLVDTAQHFRQQQGPPPPCAVLALVGDQTRWLRAAFDTA